MDPITEEGMTTMMMNNMSDALGTWKTPETPSGEDGTMADDAIWILTSTFIIFTMQSGM